MLDVGTLEIPAQKLTFFDPEKKNVKTISSRPLTITIREGLIDPLINVD